MFNHQPLLYLANLQDKVKISPRQGMVNIMIIAWELGNT